MLHMKHIDNTPSTPGKFKMEKPPYNRLRLHSSLAKLTFWSFVFLGLIFVFFFRSPSSSSPVSSDLSRRSLRSSYGGPNFEKRVRASAKIRSRNGISVLVTGAAGFVGSHVSAALKRRGDGVLGLDNFNNYYDPSLKRARQALLERNGCTLWRAGVRYAMENPSSYVHSNIAGLVNLLEACKNANPQPAIVWASSSSVYGLNTKVPFSERDRTDQPASLYAATKKAEKSTGSGGKKKGPAQLRVYNLGNTSPVPVSDLVSILEKLLKVKAKRLVMKLPRNGDVQFTHANISSAQRELGYKPTTDLKTGLKKFVEWYLGYYAEGKKSAQ
ncbi:UNVERIFIED_CONTAM: UDP-glucuronate 4-epimerase 3 [Sesamum calycinum]|uniref:UDP-glucuronate 4-epimerase 3 n=1 Tax=Sesamum calycinum TaxID=2727403 RepID=A0AAW2KYQ9_9LAMI